MAPREWKSPDKMKNQKFAVSIIKVEAHMPKLPVEHVVGDAVPLQEYDIPAITAYGFANIARTPWTPKKPTTSATIFPTPDFIELY